MPLAGLIIAFSDDFFKTTSPCRVSKFFAGFFRYTKQIQVLKLMLEMEHLQYWVLELFLLIFFWAGSI